jgi:hypothetical protein
MTTLYMTRGDLKPFIEATLKYLDGTTVDLTDSSGVVFNMKKKNGPVIISGKAGSIIDDSSPEVKPSIVRYDWEKGDTDVDGVCLGEFVATFIDGPAEEGGEPVSKELKFPAKVDFEIRFRERQTA